MLYNRERRRFTAEEYLSLDEKAGPKSEFCDGEIFAMSGGSVSHNRIVRNLLRQLDIALEGKPCEVFPSDMRLHVERFQLYTYPDLLVACGGLKLFPGRTDTLIDATLVIEVLSDSTQSYDRTEKFRFYRGLPSFAEYVLVSQDSVRIEQHRRQSADQWLMTEHTTLDVDLVLSSIEVQIPLRAIYRDV